jgi:hypothetical protein
MFAFLTMLMLPTAAVVLRTDEEINLDVNPVSKIVKLLKDMQTRLMEEGATDEEIHEKMTCWCTVTDKEKNASIEEATRTIDQMTSLIEEKSALSAQLKTEIENLKAEMEKAAEAIQTATEMRAEEKAEFTAEEKELMETIAALTQALEVLSKHQSFLGLSTKLESLRHLAARKEMQRVRTLIQQSSPTQSAKSYNSRSGEIFGILSQMKETFEDNLSTEMKEETRSQEMFEELVEEKKKGIEVARERKNTKVMELSEAEVALVNAKHTLKDARETLSADQKFLVDMKKKCSESEEEYNERNKSRQEEIAAVGDALNILTGDQARDLFTSSLGFTQVRAETTANAAVRTKLVAALKKAASEQKSAELQMLAMSAELDAFTKVKAAIDEMIEELGVQQKDEYEHREWCKKELRKNEVSHKEKTWKSEDLTKANNVLADTIEQLDGEIKALEEAVAAAKRTIKRASEDRKMANKEYQQTVADQNGAVVILNKVLERLQEVYAPEALAEKRAAATSTPAPAFLQSRAAQPEGFKGGGKQSSGGVLGLIEMTIADAERLKEESVKGEQEQQTTYEELVADTSAEINADNLSIQDKSEAKATAETEKAETEASLKGTEQELSDLEAFAVQLHSSCDFVVNNFELRQTARADEIESLKNAKAILSGAK